MAAAQVELGRADVRHQPGAEPAREPRLEALERMRRAVGGDHQPFARRHELVDRVEEFLLRRILAADELEIVDHQQVDAAQPPLEAVRVLGAQGLDEFEHEALRRHVDRRGARIAVEEGMADRMHQVRLALAGARMEIERLNCGLPGSAIIVAAL